MTTKDPRAKLGYKILETETKLDVQMSAQVPPAPAKKNTSKAAAQFRSPLASGLSSSTPIKKSIGAPNIQALQRRVQLLKRAIKIKNDGDEEKLGELAKKWTDAGREVAWELWGVVKESIVPGEIPGSSKCGWKDGGQRNGEFGGSWGWDGDEKAVESEVEMEVKEDSMGMMLRQMRIDPDTLGWDEEEGEFVDH